MLKARNENLFWLYRCLILLACVVMLASFVNPWWSGNFETGESVKIYGWGLRHNLNVLDRYLDADVTPSWQVIIAWVFVGISVVLALTGCWLKTWQASLILVTVGLGFISYAVIAIFVVVSNRLDDFHVLLQGTSIIGEMEAVSFYSQIQPGYFLAYFSGALMIMLGLFRAIITHDKSS